MTKSEQRSESRFSCVMTLHFRVFLWTSGVTVTEMWCNHEVFLYFILFFNQVTGSILLSHRFRQKYDMNYIVYFRSKCSAFITWTENSPRGHRKFLTVKIWRRVWACFSLLSVINVTWMKTLSRRFRAAGFKFLRFRFVWRQRTRPPAGEKRELRHCALRRVLTLSVWKLSIRMISLWWENRCSWKLSRVRTLAFTE